MIYRQIYINKYLEKTLQLVIGFCDKTGPPDPSIPRSKVRKLDNLWDMVEHFWLQGIWNWLGFPFILVSLAFINMFYDVLWMLLSKKTIEFKCFCLVFVHKIIETPHPHASECPPVPCVYIRSVNTRSGWTWKPLTWFWSYFSCPLSVINPEKPIQPEPLKIFQKANKKIGNFCTSPTWTSPFSKRLAIFASETYGRCKWSSPGRVHFQMAVAGRCHGNPTFSFISMGYNFHNFRGSIPSSFSMGFFLGSNGGFSTWGRS